MSAYRRAQPLARGAESAWLLAAAVVMVVAGIFLHTSGTDSTWIVRVHAHAPSPFSIVAWSCITVLGLGSSALILVLAADRGDGEITALLLPTFVLGALLTHLPKGLVAMPRPAATAVASHLHVIGQTFLGAVSMPSGHAVTAGAATVLLCMALGRGRTMVVVLLAIAGAVVAWSRVVVGAHWPSDIFVGAGLGLAAVGLVLHAAKWRAIQRAQAAMARRIRTRRGQFVVAAIEIAVAIALLSERTGYPEARPMVVLLAMLAAGSALQRCRLALSMTGRAPVEPT